MMGLTEGELQDLQNDHRAAVAGHLPRSYLVRKGWEIRDYTEPLGRRFLTDAEIEQITGKRPASAGV